MITLLATDLEPHKLPVGTGVVGEGEIGEPLCYFSSLSPLAVPLLLKPRFRVPRLTVAGGTDKEVPGMAGGGTSRTTARSCRRPLPAAPAQNPVSADCGRQNGTSPEGKPLPYPQTVFCHGG